MGDGDARNMESSCQIK